MIKPGIYPHLSNDHYHTDTAISRSGIMMFLDSPYKYWAHYINPDRPSKKQTDAMEFGSAFHMLVLEPDLFDENYIMKPKKVLLKEVGEELYRKYKSVCDYIENHELIALEFEDFNTLCRMRDAILNHKEAYELIQNAVIECSHFWEDPHTGIMCKARPDVLSQNYVVDLKTIANASPSYFQRAMSDHGYHIQAAMIRDAIRENGGADIKTFINICIEKTYPYQIGIYIIDDEALEIGRQEYKQALLDMKVCREKDEWPSYEIQSINLPTWRKK